MHRHSLADGLNEFVLSHRLAQPGERRKQVHLCQGDRVTRRQDDGNTTRQQALHQRTGDERLRIGVHIRRGDFNAPMDPGAYTGNFNVAIPMAWYEAIVRELYRAFGQHVVFVIASDARPEELISITSNFPCVTTHDISNSDISDLLTLADSDFLVCSISSFSLWAAFLGRMPYAWFAPQLSLFESSRSIWGHLPMQQQSESPLGLARNSAMLGQSRGVAIDLDGRLPSDLLARLETAYTLKSRANDLIRYGVVAE